VLNFGVQAYGYAFFAPGIIKTYGYTPIGTQLHSVPPWAAAFGFSMIVAYISDKTKHRFLFTLIPICISITGFAILITTHTNHSLEYGALFLVTCGTYSAMPGMSSRSHHISYLLIGNLVIVCWFNMNLGGHHRKLHFTNPAPPSLLLNFHRSCGWLSLANRFRQYWRHHCNLLFPG
jgi:hypothetical protein